MQERGLKQTRTTNWRTGGRGLTDVVGAARESVAVDRPLLGVGERLLLAEPAQVDLPPPGVVVAGRAPDEATCSGREGEREGGREGWREGVSDEATIRRHEGSWQC